MINKRTLHCSLGEENREFSASKMFRVTPVPENRERKVSFSPDIDESYRHQVVDKIKTLMDEVSTIHEKEEKQLKKQQENESWEFKQKQELELQAFLKKQREDASSLKTNQTNAYNDMKERQTQETWKLFGRAPSQPSRPSITNLWAVRGSPVGGGSGPGSRSSPWSPGSSSTVPSPQPSTAQPGWQQQNPGWGGGSNQNPWGNPSNGEPKKSEALNYWNS